jgi:hypothetical protein
LAGGLPVRAGSAEALLGIIAASMLTFVGVVFTITLVALQLASAQLSPRVIRTFVRSGITKLAFGLFLATFAYAIIVIVVEGASSRASVQRLAVTLGVLFVLASLVVFVVYVTATMRLLQVSWVVTVSWSLLPPERSSPTIPWLLLGRIREDFADDTARCRSGQAMRNRSHATSKWSRYWWT